MCGIQLCSISSFPTNITFIQNLLSLSQTRLVNFEIRFWTLIEFCVVTMHYRLCTSQVRHTDISQDWNFKFEILLIRDVVVKHCYRRFGCETIPPTQKFISINLLQMSCVKTWAWSFLTYDVVEAVWGQKYFGTLTQRLVHPSAPLLLTKDLSKYFISFDSPFSLHIWNSRTKTTF